MTNIQYNNMVTWLHEWHDMQQKVTSKETGSNQIYVSALIGGMMKVLYISQGKRHNDILEDELLTHDVDLNQPVCHMEFKEAKRLLKWLEDLEIHHMFENKESVTEFVPLLEGMQGFMAKHNKGWLTRVPNRNVQANFEMNSIGTINAQLLNNV